MTRELNQPLGGNEMPRFAGIASMFRLPTVEDAKGLDVAIIGVPLDIGTSNRTGTRYGPRQIRMESVLVRPYGMATGAAPFDSFQVADTGDVAINAFNLRESIGIIEEHYDRVLDHDAIFNNEYRVGEGIPHDFEIFTRVFFENEEARFLTNYQLAQ